MTIAVTGASGHLGGNLVRQLVEQGAGVRAVTFEPTYDRVPALDGLDVERIQADVRDARSIAAALEGAEVVFHLAARISIVRWDAADVLAVNLNGTRNVIDACIANGVRRLVHVSSFHAIAPSESKATDDDRPVYDDPTLPPYARSKAAAERLVKRASEDRLDAVIVSPTAMIGPWDTVPSMFGQVLLDLWRGRMPAIVSGGVNLVDVRDVAAVLRAAADLGTRGQRYIVGGSWLSLPELAQIACPIAGRRPPRIVLPMAVAHAVAPVATAFARVARRVPRFSESSLLALEHHRLVLGSRALGELGHTPRFIEDTLADTYEWFVRHNYLPDRTATGGVRAGA